MAISKNEKIYNIIVFLLGTAVYAAAVVNLQDIVAQLNVTSGIFKSRFDRITAFLMRENVPEHILLKVLKCFSLVFVVMTFYILSFRIKLISISFGFIAKGQLEKN